MKIEIDEKSRLVGAVNQDSYKSAEDQLRKMKILIAINSDSVKLLPMQAAILTAINTGKRCFQGGVDIHLSEPISNNLLFWDKSKSLEQEMLDLGAAPVESYQESDYDFILHFGQNADEQNSVEVIASSWIGAVTRNGFKLNEYNDYSLPMGGVLAGSLAVGKAFVYCLNKNQRNIIEDSLINLWNLSHEDFPVASPIIKTFPEKLWLLGMGHLGQAYAWTLSMLPIIHKLKMTLQDDDNASKANWESSLLTEALDIGKKKTRISSRWLESKGAETTLIERRYDATFKRQEKEPAILLCGLDNIEGRLNIDHSNFNLIIDCGLGGDVTTFDHLKILLFPNLPKLPSELWDKSETGAASKALSTMYENELGCGYYEKGISTSFVGAFSSSFVVSELVKAYNKGTKTQVISCSIRDSNDSLQSFSENNYTTELAPAGFIMQERS